MHFQVGSSSRGNTSKLTMGMMDDDDDHLGGAGRVVRGKDIDHSSGAEDDQSE